MDRWATRDNYEREDDEAERLMRPSPKVKPPRPDRRREDTEPESDPDLAGDPDLSLNYKSVGGSANRVLARFLQAEAPEDRIRVRKKDTGNVTYVTKKTLEERGDEYESVDDNEEKPGAPSEGLTEKPTEEKPDKPQVDFGAMGRQLQEKADADPAFKQFVKSVSDPTSAQGGLPTTFPLKRFKNISFPEGLETLGDLQQALQARKPGAKAKPSLGPDKPREAPKAPSEKPQEAPKAPVAPVKAEPSGPVKKSPAKKEVPPAPKDKAPKQPKADPKAEEEAAAKAVVDKFVKRVNADPKEVDHLEEYFRKLPSAQNTDTAVNFYDRTTKEFRPFDKLPLTQQKKIIEDYDRSTQTEKDLSSVAAAIKGQPKAQEALSQLLDPKSALSKSLAELQSKEHELDTLPIEQNIPDLKGVKFPESIKTIADLQKFVRSKPDAFIKEDYTKTRKYDSASDKIKKNVDDLRQISADPEVAKVLQALSDPTSDLAQKFTGQDLEGLIIGREIPALKGVKLPKEMTLGDLIAAAKLMNPPLPDPARRGVTKDEQQTVYTTLGQTIGFGFAGEDPLVNKIFHLGLHPDDITDLITQYKQLSKVKIRPENLEAEIQSTRHLFVTDPSEVPYPTQGLDVQGKIRNWDELNPKEKANVYAKKQNEVLAASLVLRKRVTDALMEESGIPRALADTMAASMLTPKTGDPEEQARKARKAAQNVYESVFRAGKKPVQLKDTSVERVLKRVQHDPAAQRIAVAYFQAQDYLAARAKFLSSDGPDQIDERESPKVFASKLLRATQFIEQKQRRYPKEYRSQNDPAAKFRTRVMKRLFLHYPKKAAQIAPLLQQSEKTEWDALSTNYDQMKSTWETACRKYDREYTKAETAYNKDLKSQRPYRTRDPVKTIEERLEEQGVRMPPRPDPIPPKPATYHDDQPGWLRSKGKKLWNTLKKGPLGDPLAGLDKFRIQKTASEQIVFRYLTCKIRDPMDHKSRQGIYWGVNPYPAGTGPETYARSEQSQARAIGASDLDALLDAARTWLKSSVLAAPVEGILPDIQLRAALDLAIRDFSDGKYSVGLHPTLYNKLLARLAGKSQAETLLTVREASSGSLYIFPIGEERPMSASAEIRKYAATIADAHPGVAFDLANLSFKLAEEEQEEKKDQGQEQAKQAGQIPEAFKEHMKEKKEEGGEKKEEKKEDEGQKQASVTAYTTLKTNVIKLAQANPNARASYMPLLQLIKQLG